MSYRRWRRMLRWSGICLALCVASGPGLAQQRANLPGYGEIRFGMSESDLRGKVAVVKSHDNDHSGVWLKGTQTVDIAGKPFALLILVDNGAVRRISLLRIGPVTAPDCRPGFDRLVDYLTAHYGAPDAERTPGMTGITESHRAIFNFFDGAMIEVDASLAADKDACFQSIVHFSPEDGRPTPGAG